MSSNVTSVSADSCATNTARQLERLTWRGRAGSALRPLVSAELALGVRAEIPRFFYAAEIAAAGMLLFFRKSAAMGFLTLRVREFALSRADSKPKTGR